MRSITVSTGVFAAIWAKREGGEETEDAILQRLLGCKDAAPVPANETVTLGTGVQDARNGVHFPEGFEIFRTYRSREYRAVARGGMWQRLDTQERYPTLNQLNQSIADGNENVWNGNWKFRDQSGKQQSIAKLRH